MGRKETWNEKRDDMIDATAILCASRISMNPTVEIVTKILTSTFIQLGSGILPVTRCSTRSRTDYVAARLVQRRPWVKALCELTAMVIFFPLLKPAVA